MTIRKEPKSLRMPTENEYGYFRAAKVGDTIYLASQVGHDDEGKVLNVGNMEVLDIDRSVYV